MIWCNLVEMSQEDRKVKMKTVRKKWAWSEEINRKNNIDFNEGVCLSADVHLRSLTSSKGFYDLFFGKQSWELLLKQTNQNANQK